MPEDTDWKSKIINKNKNCQIYILLQQFSIHSQSILSIPWVPEVIFLFFFLRAKRASNAAKPRQRGAKRREKK